MSDLERSRALVEPAVRGRGGLEHRVLARHVVRGERQVEARRRSARDARRGTASAGFTISMSAPSSTSARDLAQRLARVRRIHLVAAAVAELAAPSRPPRGTGRRRPRRTSPRSDRIARLDEPRVVERRRGSRRRGRPSCRTARRRRRRRAACETRRAREQLERRVVVDLAVAPSTPQWPWSVYSHRQTSVDDRQARARARLDRADRRAARRRRRRRRSSPRRPCRSGSRTAARRRSPASASRERLLGEQVEGQVPLTPGNARDRRSLPSPAHDEERLHEVCRVETRLADDPADRLAAAQSPEARGRKGHQSPHGTGASPRFASRKVRPAFCRR